MRRVVTVLEENGVYSVEAHDPRYLLLGALWICHAWLQIPELGFVHAEARALVDKIRGGNRLPPAFVMTRDKPRGAGS